MTPKTRRRVNRYGIAVDLVILETGTGLLYPGHPLLLVCVYLGAVAVSAWKGGWVGGLTAIGASVVTIAASFLGAEFDTIRLLVFVVSALVLCAIVSSTLYRGSPVAMPQPVAFEPAGGGEPLANVVAFDRADDRLNRYADFERERARLEPVVQEEESLAEAPAPEAPLETAPAEPEIALVPAPEALSAEVPIA